MFALPDAPHVPTATVRDDWTWTEALAAARPGVRYRITSLLFSLVRERCQEEGCAEGDELVCRENRGGHVVAEFADGRALDLEREVAWFVQVAPLDGPRAN